jgi:hypothetical protein
MPTLLAPPPPPRVQPGPSQTARLQLELPSVSFFGRTLAEYTRFFDLDPNLLRGRDVLDVAAGPASFVAEACARRIHAVGVDPLYGASPDELAGHVQLDYAKMFAQMRAKSRLFKLKAHSPGSGPVFPSLAAAEEDRRAAAERFLADYTTHFAHGRYVSGALPRLPFFDGTFDVVLCAHLLFVYAQRFDFDWHLAACRELVRVSASEVRIHPPVGLDGKPYPGLTKLRRELKAGGIASDVVAVDYEFFTGTNSTLVLKRTNSN